MHLSAPEVGGQRSPMVEGARQWSWSAASEQTGAEMEVPQRTTKEAGGGHGRCVFKDGLMTTTGAGNGKGCCVFDIGPIVDLTDNNGGYNGHSRRVANNGPTMTPIDSNVYQIICP